MTTVLQRWPLTLAALLFALAAPVSVAAQPARVAPADPAAQADALRRSLAEAVRIDDDDAIRQGIDALREVHRELRQSGHALQDAEREAVAALEGAVAGDTLEARRVARRTRRSNPQAWQELTERVRQLRWDELRTSLLEPGEPAAALPAEAVAELGRHAARVARVERIRDLAARDGDASTLARVDEVMDLELARHIGTLARLGVEPAAPATATARPHTPPRPAVPVSPELARQLRRQVAPQDVRLLRDLTGDVAVEAVGTANQVLERALEPAPGRLQPLNRGVTAPTEAP